MNKDLEKVINKLDRVNLISNGGGAFYVNNISKNLHFIADQYPVE